MRRGVRLILERGSARKELVRHCRIAPQELPDPEPMRDSPVAWSSPSQRLGLEALRIVIFGEPSK